MSRKGWGRGVSEKYRIYSRRSREILDKIWLIFSQFDLYAGRLVHEYIRYYLLDVLLVSSTRKVQSFCCRDSCFSAKKIVQKKVLCTNKLFFFTRSQSERSNFQLENILNQICVNMLNSQSISFHCNHFCSN